MIIGPLGRPGFETSPSERAPFKKVRKIFQFKRLRCINTFSCRVGFESNLPVNPENTCPTWILFAETRLNWFVYSTEWSQLVVRDTEIATQSFRKTFAKTCCREFFETSVDSVLLHPPTERDWWLSSCVKTRFCFWLNSVLREKKQDFINFLRKWFRLRVWVRWCW